MNIVLINPPYYFKKNLEFLSQNLGLGYIASYLEKYGKHRIQIIDALAEGQNIVMRVLAGNRTVSRIGLPYDKIVQLIPYNTDLIGISAPFTNHARIVQELSFAIKKKYPKIPIVLGGVYPSILPMDALTDSIDHLIIGEGETTMLKLANGESPEKIDGLVFKKDGRIVNTGIAQPVINLDDIPFPARKLLPMKKYLNFSPRARSLRTVSIITSRGCPFNCAFCSIHPVFGYKWRARSSENVIREIVECKEKYKIEHVEFEDDNLTLDKKRAEQIFDLLTDLRISWSMDNGIRIDTLDRIMVGKMKKSGCSYFVVGLEHGSPEILRKMNKNLNLIDVENIVRICHEVNLPIEMYYMVGYPGETEKIFQEGLNFAKHLRKLGVSRFSVRTTKAYPGTNLYRFCKKREFLKRKKLDEELFFDDTVNIITENFSESDVLRRRRYVQYLNYRFLGREILLIQRMIKWFFSPKIISLVKIFLIKIGFKNRIRILRS